METINKNAIYILIRKIFVDCHDIKNIVFLGYGIKEETHDEPDRENKIYRIIFNDDTYWESYLDRTSIEVYNDFKKNENSSNASE